MGSCKQLLPLGDKTAIARCIEAMMLAPISDISVIVNQDGSAVADAVSMYPVTIGKNIAPESDMAESVRVGLRSIDSSATGVIVALADHPLVTPETYAILMEHHRAEPDRVIIPVHGEKKGHPTLFPRTVLEKLTGPLTLRDLISGHYCRVLFKPVSDVGVVLDMDTRKDYERIAEIALSGLKEPSPGSPS